MDEYELKEYGDQEIYEMKYFNNVNYDKLLDYKIQYYVKYGKDISSYKMDDLVKEKI